MTKFTTKIMLAVVLVAATPGTAYAGNRNSGEQCVFTMNNGGWAWMSCMIGKFKKDA